MIGGSAHRAGGGGNGARTRRRVRAEAKAGPAMAGGGARAERRAPGFGCELREDEPKRKEVRSPTSVTSERRPQRARPAPRSAYLALLATARRASRASRARSAGNGWRRRVAPAALRERASRARSAGACRARCACALRTPRAPAHPIGAARTRTPTQPRPALCAASTSRQSCTKYARTLTSSSAAKARCSALAAISARPGRAGPHASRAGSG